MEEIGCRQSIFRSIFSQKCEDVILDLPLFHEISLSKLSHDIMRRYFWLKYCCLKYSIQG